MTPANRMTAPFDLCTCGAQHHPGSNYYVSVLDGDRHVLAAGPYSTHAQALGMVAPVNRLVQAKYDYQGRAAWYAFGTVAMKPGYRVPGKLNAELGVTP